MNLYVLRNRYNTTTTEGLLLLQDRFFCYTLEDVVRPKGAPKVQDQTAIPAGRYQVVVSLSPRFQRKTAEILNVPGFVDIRIHAGNTSADTSGCLIVAHNRINDTTIQGTAEAELTACLKASPGTHWIEIVDTFPYVGIS
jgi:hypothetical protein